ncbi:MAG TPA: site-2 protease family protein [Candidatus Binatia bacterium]|nr:site-2 protease family protein [Candidatus Binatia bacterium]
MEEGATDVIARIAIVAVPVLAAIVLHEVAHGAVAWLCGDPTAARAGRLTLNPIPHIDPFGTVILPGLLLLAPLLFGTRPLLFGYARPVPIDVRQLRHPRRDSILVALAGPGTNLALAGVSAVALGIVLSFVPSAGDAGTLTSGIAEMLGASVVINCVLAVFNLLPVPPLDGGRVLTALLPLPAARALARVEGIGFIVVLLVVMNTGVVRWLTAPVLEFFYGLAAEVAG